MKAPWYVNPYNLNSMKHVFQLLKRSLIKQSLYSPGCLSRLYCFICVNRSKANSVNCCSTYEDINILLWYFMLIMQTVYILLCCLLQKAWNRVLHRARWWAWKAFLYREVWWTLVKQNIWAWIFFSKYQ